MSPIRANMCKIGTRRRCKRRGNSNGAPYAVSGLSVADDINVGRTNALGVSSLQDGQTATTGDGSFPDTYYVCSSDCPGSGQSDATQNWIVVGIPLPHRA